jgi:hypothetical protein
MRRSLYQRQLVLLAVALLGLVAALAVSRLTHPHAAALPAREGTYSALAGLLPRLSKRQRLTGCNVRVGPATEGIENPVLPCGIRLYLSFRGTTVLASVIGHQPVPAGREFNLTAALARSLGLSGVRRVGWSYAGEAS